jgi:N-methylhydantoinase B/oxoprolinase/acetone carboxylase alpha subunit
MKAQEREELLQALRARFEKNKHRHKAITWADVRARLEANADALRSLREMEATGGEPERLLRP